MKAIGIVLAGGNSKRMRELSNKRAISAMPVAGSYRSIDFALSNMSNSHIQNVAVFTQYNSRSLNEHLSSSKWWDFGRKQGGLYVFTPTITAENSDWYRGTADALYQNLTFLKNSHEPYVVIAAGDGIYKLDYNKVLEYHIEKKADITVVCKDMPETEDITRFGQVKLNDDGRIIDFDEKPMVSTSSTISCGIYVIRRRQLRGRRPCRLCPRYPGALQKLKTYLCIQAEFLLEQYRFCRVLLQDQYGLLKAGGTQLFLQGISGCILQGG